MCAPDGLNDTDLPAQCNDTDFDSDDVLNDMSAMVNPYESSLYCSEYFLELYRQRLLDPWLTSSNFTDYLISEFDGVQSNCSTKLTNYGYYCVNYSHFDLLGTNFVSTQQFIGLYNVFTGDARVATGNYNCVFNSTICLPLPCGTDTVWDEPSCADLAQRYSNTTYNITETQFLSWNSNIQGTCDGIAPGQKVCTEAPGGTFPSPTTSIYAQTGTTYYTTATPAYPTQSGSIHDCGSYYLVVSGDDCYTVDVQFGITFAQLQEYNTFLDANCTNLWLNYDVCVGEVTPPTVSTDGTCGVGVTCEDSGFGDYVPITIFPYPR
ncbi:hypothetical protein VPNG_03306 [Cytospora leucostoma]|uniref:LysM domain-containing protein n=1 Tax=Cytospora leucostoma TaxID=1230097 RepID=A0A423XFF9_9PEZI|nr:hypothetical protein VPNG_03306 [Cytospora leucostoma]